MNQNLWDEIQQFDFDNPPSEYCFSIRLANENYWTKNFTDEAILEYRKFMYMAATSNHMVSPSEIVDAVWHQHLIFTQSYQDFCAVLGKQIQHVPSTHTREEFSTFKQAKERTRQLYEENFGAPPHNIWGYSDMYESLHLPKAKLKIRGFILIGILMIVLLIVPFYYLLRPVYVTMDNPYFMIGFVLLIIASIAALEIFNRNRLRQIVKRFDKYSFIYHLQPAELIYLKTQDLSQVINGTVNELVENETIHVHHDGTLELAKNGNTHYIEQLQITSTLSERGRISYPMLLYTLRLKPVFRNASNCMDAFQKYFVKSKAFGRVFYINFGVFAVLFLIGFVRLTTGLLRDKPVTQIAIAIIALVIVFIFLLNRLTRLVCTDIIPQQYRRELLPAGQMNHSRWKYFLFGTAVLVPAFAPLTKPQQRYGDETDSGSNSCGSSCGASCGSSCGGCGGGD